MKKKLEWSVNTPELLGEIIPNVMGKESISPSIIRIFASLLGEVAKRATELHDAKLDSLMLRLNLYELDGRNSKERNENRVRLIDQLEKEAEKQNIMNKKKINAFDCICVTDVKIQPVRQIEGVTHTRAIAEIVFNDQLLIRGIRVVEGANGLYISYPYPLYPTTGEDGQQRSSVFPITKMLRDHVEAVVLEKYQDAVKMKNG